MNVIKEILNYSHVWEAHYTGIGYIEGAGFDLKIRRLKILGFSFITDIRLNVEGEWLTKRKDNLVKRRKQDYLFQKHLKEKKLK